MMAKFRHEFREPLDVAPRRRREGRDEFVDERLVERQIELPRHDAPNAPARVVVGRIIFDQRDAARNDGFVYVVDAIGREKQQPVEIFEHAQEHADDGVLSRARISMGDDEPTEILFDENGAPIRG